MRIKINDEWRKEPLVEELSRYVEDKCDDFSYDSGQIESLERKIDKTARVFGRLVDTLASKGLLTLDEVADIVQSYDTLTKVEDDGHA